MRIIDDDELNINPPTPCHWQVPVQTKTQGKWPANQDPKDLLPKGTRWGVRVVWVFGSFSVCVFTSDTEVQFFFFAKRFKSFSTIHKSWLALKVMIDYVV